MARGAHQVLGLARGCENGGLFGRYGAVGSELWEEPASEEQQIQTGLPSSKCKNAKEKKGHSSSVKESYEVLLLTWKNSNYILEDFIFMLNHYFIIWKRALFTKEHYVLANYKNKYISLCFLKHPWKPISALLLFCCGGVQLKMQIRADQSEALKPRPL